MIQQVKDLGEILALLAIVVGALKWIIGTSYGAGGKQTAIEASIKSGFELVKLEFSSGFELVKLEFSRDILAIKAVVESKLEEVLRRLSTAEGDCENDSKRIGKLEVKVARLEALKVRRHDTDPPGDEDERG